MANGGANICHLCEELWIIVHGVGDFLNTVDNCGVITVPEEKADAFERELGVLTEEVHGEMASVSDSLSPKLTGESLEGDVEVGGDSLEDAVWV